MDKIIFYYYNYMLYSKRELITTKLQNIEENEIYKNLPFFSKISELKNKYEIPKIVALIERFIIPAFEQNALKDYLLLEFDRYKLLNPSELADFTPTNHQIDQVIDDLTYLIKVIQA